MRSQFERSLHEVLFMIGIVEPVFRRHIFNPWMFYAAVVEDHIHYNLDTAVVAFGIVSAGYLGFKTNAVLRKDLKNKNLKFADSMIATLLGIVVASLVVALAPRDILWLFLLIFALAYNLLHLIVRIKVEHDGTNREL